MGSMGDQGPIGDMGCLKRSDGGRGGRGGWGGEWPCEGGHREDMEGGRVAVCKRVQLSVSVDGQPQHRAFPSLWKLWRDAVGMGPLSQPLFLGLGQMWG